MWTHDAVALVAEIVTNRDNLQNHKEEAESESGLYCGLATGWYCGD